MPLVHGTVYAIQNALTHTVIDFTGDPNRNFAFVTGWGWHGGNNQKWKLIQVGGKWKLQNQRGNSDHFLCPQLEDGQTNGNYRLAGGIVECEFDIQRVGLTDGYRILFNNNLAVTLVSGHTPVHNIKDCDRVVDIHADGSPIALQPVVGTNHAQIWSFPAHLPVTLALQNDRAYKVVNSHTGTVLDVADTVGKPVLGLVSEGGDDHKWTVRRWTHYLDQYTFKSSTIADHFLIPDVAQDERSENGTALIGGTGAQPAPFTVRNVPGTLLYKIFFDHQASGRGLAVNLPVVDEAPDSLDRAVVSLQTAEAQKWYFIE